jgi:hypothetical protein
MLLSWNFCDRVTCSLMDIVIVHMQKLLHCIHTIGKVVLVHTLSANRDRAVKLYSFLFLLLYGGEWSDLHHCHVTLEVLKCITLLMYKY